MSQRRFRVGLMYFVNLLPLFLFNLSVLGIILNRTNLILILICIEMMLLSITLNLLIHSLSIDAILGQLCAMYVLTVAAVETALGLAIIIAFYKLKGSISIRFLNLLKG